MTRKLLMLAELSRLPERLATWRCRRTRTTRSRRRISKTRRRRSRATWCSSCSATRTRSCMSRARTRTGNTVRYAVEWGAGLQLNRQGVTRETLKPGDHVIITGNPGRNPEDHRLRMRTITRPSDGWKWGGTFD